MLTQHLRQSIICTQKLQRYWTPITLKRSDSILWKGDVDLITLSFLICNIKDDRSDRQGERIDSIFNR
jgi:hypothetical protein